MKQFENASGQTGVSPVMLDLAGLIWLALSGASLSAAFVTENPMGMGVLMGLFAGALLTAVTLFACARSAAVAPSYPVPRGPAARSSGGWAAPLGH